MRRTRYSERPQELMLILHKGHIKAQYVLMYVCHHHYKPSVSTLNGSSKYRAPMQDRKKLLTVSLPLQKQIVPIFSKLHKNSFLKRQKIIFPSHIISFLSFKSLSFMQTIFFLHFSSFTFYIFIILCSLFLCFITSQTTQAMLSQQQNITAHLMFPMFPSFCILNSF